MNIEKNNLTAPREIKMLQVIDGGQMELKIGGPKKAQGMNIIQEQQKNMIKKVKSRLTDERNSFKPFNYPFAYDAWLKHEQSHWLN